MTLLQETILKLANHNKKPSDVRWVGTLRWYMTWEEFADKSNTHYNTGYGGQEVNPDIAIVGEDWWLERHEYDGSEWWEYKQLPKQPQAHEPDRTVTGNMFTIWSQENALQRIPFGDR